MLYDSYEQVITRDRPEWWWRLGRHGETVMSVGQPGKATSMSSLSQAAANNPYAGPSLPGAVGRSTHCIGTSASTTSASAQGWGSAANHTLAGTNANGWTMEVWVQPQAALVGGRAYHVFTRGTQLFGLWFVGEAPIFSLNGTGTIAFNNTGNASVFWQAGQWMHLVGIARNGSSQFWTNGLNQTAGAGSPDTSSSLANVSTSLATNVSRSGHAASFYSFPGYIAEPAIYDYALSPSQIVEHYETGLRLRRNASRFAAFGYPFPPPAPPPPPPPGGLTAITEGLPNRRVLLVSDRPR